MNHLESIREKNINNIISIVKLFSLLFCGIVILQNIDSEAEGPIGKIGLKNVNIISVILMIIIMAIIFTIWSFVEKGEISETRRQRYEITLFIESLFFIAVFTGLVITSGADVSQYKFLYLFIIITSTIQLGMKYGVFIASISSAIVLSIDLFYGRGLKINSNFEYDLIMAGIFLLTAWPLGYYVKVENNHRKELLHLANVDGLTGLYNHRYFQEKLSETLKTSRKSNFPFSLLILDIDHFKHYNDNYGHQQGDYLLQGVGKVLLDNVRQSDVVSRYGGEEFTVILPFTSKEKAVTIAERIRQSIEREEFEGGENQPGGRVTISIGVSCFPENASNEVEIIKSADEALYKAKFFNKNRVEAYYSILDELKKDMDEAQTDLISSIKTLISVINAKDRYTFGHVERVVLFSKLLGERLGLSEDDKKLLKYGAYLHDIGKINVPKEILIKKTALSDEEWQMLKQHPSNGVQIIKSVDFLKEVVPIILYHHENYDGRGYPEGLKGENIPYLARILSVVDSYDAMTSTRPYNKRKSLDEAVEELEKCSGSQFDPEITGIFIGVICDNRDRLHDLK